MDREFNWKLHPGSADLLGTLLARYTREMKTASGIENALHLRTSTRLFDWIDHMLVPWSWTDEEVLGDSGFSLERVEVGGLDLTKAVNDDSILFPLFLTDMEIGRLYLKVESIEDFTALHGKNALIEGKRWSPRRKMIFAEENGLSLGAMERRGYDGYLFPERGDEERYRELLEEFMGRARDGDEDDAFGVLEDMIDRGVRDIGADRTADAFFLSERRYWESRNGAGRIQLARQNGLGLGWGNHDHHTFRCSRKNFKRTIAILERIGMRPRERFYAGEQAGWGAQVMEQDACGITVFSDVDLAPEEKDGDFARQGLQERGEPGTVGLWVGLHGESTLSSGLHHLAARVSFSKMMLDSERAGIGQMAPFSNFTFLKQCFSEGERWLVPPERSEKLLDGSLIDEKQHLRFTVSGALGSHLESIERKQGFRGFNREAVSDIIGRTDPRK